MDTRIDDKGKSEQTTAATDELNGELRSVASFMNANSRYVVFTPLPGGRKYDDADDLPDLDKPLMEKLELMWQPSALSPLRPLQAMLEAFKKHYSAMNPYFEAIRADHDWRLGWSYILKIALDLDNVSEDFEKHRGYSEPEELRRNILLAETNLSHDEEKFKQDSDNYTMAIEWRMAEINQIQKLLTELESAKDMAAIDEIKRKRDIIEKVASENIQRLNPVKAGQAGADSDTDVDCWSKFRALFKKKPEPNTSKPAAKNTNGMSFEGEKARLKAEYEEDIKTRTDAVNDYPNPQKSMQYHDLLIEAKADSLFEKLKYYRSLNRDIMLKCIRLYVFTFRIYYQIFGENPILSNEELEKQAQNKSGLIYSEEEKVIFKVRDLFRQMLRGMKSNYDLYYCLQPNEYYFEEYLSNYNKIPEAEDRNRILRGEVDDKLLAKVFPDFETPKEAFTRPTPR